MGSDLDKRGKMRENVEISVSTPGQENLQRPLRRIYKVNTEPIIGSIEFQSGIIESNTGNIELVVQKSADDKPGVMYIRVNTGAVVLLVEDPNTLVKPYFSGKLSAHGSPPAEHSRIIYIVSNSSKGVEIHYPDSPEVAQIREKIPGTPPIVPKWPESSMSPTDQFRTQKARGESGKASKTSPKHEVQNKGIDIVEAGAITVITGSPILGIMLAGDEEE